jgi:hypothetical protein
MAARPRGVDIGNSLEAGIALSVCGAGKVEPQYSNPQ